MKRDNDVLIAINHEPLDAATAIGHTKDKLVRTSKIIGDFVGDAGANRLRWQALK